MVEPDDKSNVSTDQTVDRDEAVTSNAVALSVVKLGRTGEAQILREKSINIEEVDDDIKLLAESMILTMYEEPGVGIAAPQVGVNVNMIVVDPDYDPNDHKSRKPVVMINPVITKKSLLLGTQDEACLSVPNLIVPVERSMSVTVAFKDLNWNDQEFDLTAFPARVVQHEMDHLQGVLIVDYLSKLRKDLYIRKIYKQARKVKKLQKRNKHYENFIRASERRVPRRSSTNVQPELQEGTGEPGASSDGSRAGNEVSVTE